MPDFAEFDMFTHIRSYLDVCINDLIFGFFRM